MATNLIAGTFNVGTDKSIVVIDNDTGAPISLGGRIIDITSAPKAKLIESHPIDNDGYSQFRESFDGWDGTLTMDRSNGSLDTLQALKEANYHATGAQKFFTITETIRNQADSSINIFQYNYAVLMLEDSGSWKKDATVPVRAKFHAQDRVQLQ